jgi:hypothetical protein
MAKFVTELNDDLKSFIAEQKMYFVATAPQEGRINLSPKGMDTLRIVDDKTVAYLDMTGSGNETAAHVDENGRMTIMLTSFTKRAIILRLYGQARIVLPTHPEWDELYPLFPVLPAVRQIFVLEIVSISTSCGDSVPMYEFKNERQALCKY